KVTQHSYNSRGLLVLEKDANGNETEHHYNAKGLLEKSLERYFVAGTTDNYTISYEVNITDGYDFIKEKGEGLPAGFTFDATSGTLHRVAPVGEKETVYIKVTALNDVHIANVSNRVQEFTFRASDVDTKTTATVAHWQAAPKTGELYRTTEYGYDAQDNVTHKTLKSGGNEADLTWSYAYNAFGEVVKDNEGRYIYNALGQLHYTTQGDGVLKTHTYDLAGRLVSTEHALNGTTTFKRDGLGRATYIEKPVYSGSIKPSVSQTFDRWGNIIELVDEEGGVTSAQYNFRNQVTLQRLAAASYTDEMGRVTANFRAETSYDYDALGNLVSTTDANTHTNAFSYDARGNQVGHKDGEGNVTKSYYDEHGRKVITQDAAARVTTISYDKLDQVTETGQYGVLESGFGYRFNNQFEYDELGNRAIERSAMGGTKRYRFDALGNVVYSQDEVGREMRYAYNSRSEQIKKQYSDFYTSGDAHQITQVI
ncbi:hypothetical protein L1286_24030, partial [Pseudoalteromonas sp. SMS1]|uniref:hypothetical protein n=1 Tax=Pseudoalteromonas sp. SMS1 TaxID=2908894 RepID=UPI001F1B558D